MSYHKFEDFNLTDGEYTEETFVNFLKDCIDKNVLGAGKYLIMHNAKIHHSHSEGGIFERK